MTPETLAKLLMVCLVTTSCASADRGAAAQEDAPFDVLVQVVRDAEVPLAGARVSIAGKAIVTDARGAARFRVRGHDGDVVSVGVECPEGYTSPDRPVPITLYRLPSGAPPLAPPVVCVPGVRRVVAAIRARGGPLLPIVRFGRQAGRTDRAGAAHLLVEGKPGEHVELTLNTDDEAAHRLRPRNPTLSFAIPDRDDVVVLDQRFDAAAEPPPPPTKRAPPRPKTMPHRAAPPALPKRL